MKDSDERERRLEKEFDDYYARGGTGLADDVWRRMTAASRRQKLRAELFTARKP